MLKVYNLHVCTIYNYVQTKISPLLKKKKKQVKNILTMLLKYGREIFLVYIKIPRATLITCPVHLTSVQYNQDIKLSGLQKSS